MRLDFALWGSGKTNIGGYGIQMREYVIIVNKVPQDPIYYPNQDVTPF